MEKATLNIGMNTSERFGSPKKLANAQIIAALIKNGFKILDVAFIDADGVKTFEKTAVVKVEINQRNYKALPRVADQLAQDCIAVKFSRGGLLIGKHASVWGEFNPAYFTE